GVFLSRPANAALAWLFRRFNEVFNASVAMYTRAVSGLLRVSAAVVIVYGGLLFLTWLGFTTTPTGFIPPQDKGYLLVNVQLPDAASVTRTRDAVQQSAELALSTDGVAATVGMSAQSVLMGANSSTFGALYLQPEPFDGRL